MKLGDLKNLAKAYQEASHYIVLGIQLAIIVVIFFLIGKWADEKLSTYPWLMILGIFIGIAIGFYLFFKSLSEILKKSNKSSDKNET